MKSFAPVPSIVIALSLLGGCTTSAQDTAQRRAIKLRDATAPLFIEFTPTSAEQATMMDEDLNVMTRLLEKALDQGLGEDKPDVKLNLPMLFTSSGRSVRAVYLEGFGALFLIKVNFPVVAVAKAELKKQAKKPITEWDQVKSELKEDEQKDDEIVWTADPARAESEALQIEALKKILLQSLKHAANIRHLKPDEFVALSVFGSEVNGSVQIVRNAYSTAPSAASVASSANSSKKKEKGKSAANEGLTEGAEPASPAIVTRPGQPAELSVSDSRTGGMFTRAVVRGSGKAGPQGTVLTLRVKKSDVDAFAHGEVKS